MLITSKQKILGFTLVELMVGMALGLIVVFAVSTVYLNASRSNIYTVRMSQLSQETRAIMDIIVSDIRRSGYWGGAERSASNPFSAKNSTNIHLPSNSCILYSYDFDLDGEVDSGTDFFGFSFIENTIRALSSASFSNTHSVTDCADTTVFPDDASLNNIQNIVVNSLSFSTQGSACIAYQARNFDETDSNTYDTREITTANSTELACDDTSTSWTTFPDRTEIRFIRVEIETSHPQDPNLIYSLEETVLVKNNRIISGS